MTESEQNDGELYDMSKHFKEEHDKLTKEIKHKKKQIEEYKKIIMLNYSLIRLLDEFFSDCELDKVFHLQHLIDILRGKNSEFIDMFIFQNKCPVCIKENIEIEEEED